MRSIVLAWAMLLLAWPLTAEEAASPQEVVRLVQKAALFLSQKGAPGLATLQQNPGPFSQGELFVFTQSCERGVLLTHAANPKLVGMPLSIFKDQRGNLFGLRMCEAAKRQQGEWVEYWWNKPGQAQASRKISLLIQVPGQPMQVGAGIFDDHLSLQELNRLTHPANQGTKP